MSGSALGTTSMTGNGNGFGIDITERRHAEETNRELLQAQFARARAEAANKAKTAVSGSLHREAVDPRFKKGGK